MARTFTAASSSQITTAIGGLSAVTFGTIACVVKRNADAAWHGLVGLNTSAGAIQFGLEFSDVNAISMRIGASDFTSPTATVQAADNWVLVVVTKATGTVAPRFHRFSFTLGTWTHENGASTAANATAPGGTGLVKLGMLTAATTDYADVTMSAAAVWGSALSDAQVESLTANLNAWTALSPAAMWVFDQASTATALDDETNGGATQTSITGTTVASGDPLVFSTPLVYRASSGTQGFGGTSSVVLTIPAAVQTGDLMVAVVSYKLLTGTATLNTPSGWSALYSPTNGPSGSTYQGAIFTKTATGTDAGSTVTFNATSGSQQLTVAFAAYSGVASIRSSTWTVGSTTGSTSVSCPGPATAPQTGDLVVLTGVARETVNGPTGQPTFTGPTGATIRGQIAGTSGSAQNVASFIGDHDSTAGTRTVTASQTSVYIAGQIVLVPQSSALNLFRSVGDTVTVADQLSRTVLGAAGAADTTTVADSAMVFVGRVRAPADAVTAAETVTRVSARARATADTVTAAELVARSYTRIRGVADAATVVDGVARAAARVRGVADAVGFSDIGTDGGGLGRSLGDTVTAADAVARGRGLLRDGSDTVTLVDAAVRSSGRSRTVGDSVTLADLVTRVRADGRAGSDALTIADAAVKVVALVRQYAADDVGLGDAAALAAAVARAGSDAVHAADEAGGGQAYACAAADTVHAVDAVARGTSTSRPVTDAVALVDVVVLSGAAARAVVDAVGFTDSGAAGRADAVYVTESLTVADGGVQVVGRSRTLGDAVHAADTIVRLRALGRDGSDSLSTTDTAGRGVVRARAVAETVGLVVVVVAGRNTARGGADNVYVLDMAEAHQSDPVVVIIASKTAITWTSPSTAIRDTTPITGVRRSI